MKNLSSPSSLRAGNVLALLNTLYTSGFATASPGLPMLKDRTMHTLYAVSFIVYTLNATADWIHVYCTLRGLVTSFPLETWLVIVLVSTVVAGSMLTGLLLVLCVENAFAHRLDIKPYRSGLTIIAEAVVEWIQAFNNFRVAFLIMAIHDAPMTAINFFFIASCRCVGPQIIPWSLLLSCLTTNLSLIWRLTMLYFAYRRLICPAKNTAPTPGVYHFPTPHEHFLENISTHDEGRMSEYDELWPIRWARKLVYGIDPDPEEKEEFSFEKGQRRAGIGGRTVAPGNLCWSHMVRLSRLVACCWLSFLGYMAFLLSCCSPCCWHYSCRRNSFHHRHAFARSCVRYSSYAFHYGIFFFSVITASFLFILNSVLLSSVHIIGSNTVPPEINTVCIAFNVATQQIDVSFSSSSLMGTPEPPPDYDSIACKPIWEDGGLGMGLKRKPAGPWQTRKRINETDILGVSTQVIVNGSDVEKPFLLLIYDWALIRKEGTEKKRRFSCSRTSKSGWNLTLPSSDHLPFPYFLACIKDWQFEESYLIECRELEMMYTTTIVPWKFYPMGKGAYYPGRDGPIIPPRRKGGKSKEYELDRGDMRRIKRHRRRHWIK